jgi:hypothetical protein
MAYSTGKFLFIFLLAALLSSLAAWLTAHRYRSVMRRLMAAPAGQDAGPAPPATESAALAPPVAVTSTDSHRAAVRLTLLLIGLSALISLTAASLWLLLALPDEPFAPKRAALIGLVQLWPVIPALGLLWRWSWLRVLGVLALWCVFCFGVVLWRSIDPRPLEVVYYLASGIGPPLIVVALLYASAATRAVAPWLLPPFIGLVWASILGLDLLAVMVERQSAALLWLTSWLGVAGVIVLLTVLPWLVAWWPLRRFGRALGRAYARKQLSELIVLFTSIWALALLFEVLSVASTAGWAGLAMFLPLLWIPPVMWLNGRLGRLSGRPPTLLVLRVFKRDAQAQALFDHVIERWRLSGNTVLIAGTDLADRTLDAEDIFTFLDGGLGGRFIRTPAQVAPRVAAFDMAPDADGRFRINECYCHDTTWQDALQALVERSDLALMDLRGFQAHNSGCRYELGALARVSRNLRVIVLTDGETDRAAAAESVGPSPEGRFVWLDGSQIGAQTRRDVMANLFAPAAGGSAGAGPGPATSL